jgi:hypothetical protein
MEIEQSAVAIIPSSDLDETQAFCERLGFGSDPNGAVVGVGWPD